MDGGGPVLHVALRAEPTTTPERVLEQPSHVLLRCLDAELVRIDGNRGAIVGFNGCHAPSHPAKDTAQAQLG